MSDAENESGETCPVCGQAYDYFREEGPEDRTILRDDATECRVEMECDSPIPTRRAWKVYVHA